MNIGVIFAGGVGSRMHSRDLPKQFLKIHDKPIIVHTIEHFENCEEIDCVVVVCVKDWIDYLNNLIATYHLKKVKTVVAGGASGQLSIYNGLCAAAEIAKDEPTIVLIHDGVRPLISSQLLSQNVQCTLVEIDDDNNIKVVQDRPHSRVAKAPQCFWLKDILSAHEKALSENRQDFIDSCTLMQHYGYHLHMTDGPFENIKITTPDDFYTMRAILQVKEDAQIYGLE